MGGQETIKDVGRIDFSPLMPSRFLNLSREWQSVKTPTNAKILIFHDFLVKSLVDTHVRKPVPHTKNQGFADFSEEYGPGPPKLLYQIPVEDSGTAWGTRLQAVNDRATSITRLSRTNSVDDHEDTDLVLALSILRPIGEELTALQTWRPSWSHVEQTGNQRVRNALGQPLILRHHCCLESRSFGLLLREATELSTSALKKGYLLPDDFSSAKLISFSPACTSAVSVVF